MSAFETLLTQAEADHEVWAFLDRVSRVANNDTYAWEVEYAFIFGSYLRGGGVYGDINIAVQLRRKAMSRQHLSTSLAEAFRRRRVHRVLQAQSPHLSLMALWALAPCAWPFAILYRAPGAEPLDGQRLERQRAPQRMSPRG